MPYEAVAQGLAAIRGNEWVAGIAQGLNVVRVSVADIRVEHEVKLRDFTKWTDRRADRHAMEWPSEDSVDSRYAGFTIELNSFWIKLELG
jgi:hypothetical protein